MNTIILWVVLFILVLCLLRVRVINKKKQWYKSLTHFERLWYDYLEKPTNDTRENLSNFIISELGKPSTYNQLHWRYHELTAPREISYCAYFEPDKVKSYYATRSKELISEHLEETRMASSAKELKGVYSRMDTATEKSIVQAKWEKTSLLEVLWSKTLGELNEASKFLPHNSLAQKFVPFVKEEILISEIKSTNELDKLSAVAEEAVKNVVQKDTPLYQSFLKLRKLANK